MRKTLIAASVLTAIALPSFAVADDSPHSFSGNVTYASEYIFRGIAQTRGSSAFQGGFDYANKNGFYVGTWGSNISWLSDPGTGTSASLEVDVYGGYSGSITGDLGYDVGVLTYNYPGTNLPTGPANPNTVELYGALSYKWLSAKYSRTTGSLFGWTKPDGSKTSGSGYLDLTASFDLGSGYGVSGHVGHQTVAGLSDASYSDYRVGVTKDAGFATIGLTYSATNAKADCTAGEPYCFVNGITGDTYDAGKGRVVLTLSKSL